jgi:hypothetical protein
MPLPPRVRVPYFIALAFNLVLVCHGYVGSDGNIHYRPDVMVPYRSIGGDGGNSFDTTNCDSPLTQTLDIIEYIKVRIPLPVAS